MGKGKKKKKQKKRFFKELTDNQRLHAQVKD